MNAISIKNVSKAFKEKGRTYHALRNINLEIEKGEIFGLLGPNGAGKSTLLNIITGLLYHDTGTVRVLGKDVRKDRDILARINFVSGISRYDQVLTVEDILRFYGRVYGLDRETNEKRIRELAEFFSITPILRRSFSALSTGEGARLNMAKAMLNNPEVILLDEPTLGLDPKMSIKARSEIKRVNREFGTTIILTSHYMSEVEQLSDRIAFIFRGEIVDIGTVSNVKLSKFSEYEVIIELESVRDREYLLSRGFEISGNKIRRRMSNDENLSGMLSTLSRKGFRIKDIETKKPTLEDYFIEMLKEKK